MEIQEIVFVSVFGTLGLLNLVGIALLHTSKDAKYNWDCNKVVFFILTVVFTLVGFAYTAFSAPKRIKNALQKRKEK